MEHNKDSFKEKLIDISKSFKIWILIFFIIISFLAINQSFDENGVSINGIVPGSLAEKAGINFNSQLNLRSLEVITYLNDENIADVESFYNFINNLDPEKELIIKTNKNSNGYKIKFSNNINELELKKIKIMNNSNKTNIINITNTINTTNNDTFILEYKSLSDELGISVRSSPKSNIKLGIELEGGSRLILKALQNITDEEFSLLVSSLQSRLDVYGASGTKVNKLDDAFSDDKFVIVESTSSNKNDIFELISRQGEFEAKIGNDTVFTGENVVRVFSDPQNARLQSCDSTSEGYVCSYAFLIEIDDNGGNSFFAKTSSLDDVNGRLSEEVSFVMDGKEITSLSIASSFKYQKILNPQITVSGNAMASESQALESAKKEMKFLQTILSTQSLPSELEVVQSYSVSSSLGDKLLSNSIVLGFIALLLVSSIVALRYRNIGIFIGILIALVSEVIIVFGVAAFMRLSLDLAAIGGLIAAIGTGVDDQIIITDEQHRNRGKDVSSRKRLKSAMYIIMIAYITTVVAMFPFLLSAALSLVKGFAFMIIIGITVGIFITRPAYAIYLRILLTTRKQRKIEAQEEEDE